jgi:hypothetical protein
VLQTGTKGPVPECAPRRPRGGPRVPAGNRAMTKGLAFSPTSGVPVCKPGLKTFTDRDWRPCPTSENYKTAIYKKWVYIIINILINVTTGRPSRQPETITIAQSNSDHCLVKMAVQSNQTWIYWTNNDHWLVKWHRRATKSGLPNTR